MDRSGTGREASRHHLADRCVSRDYVELATPDDGGRVRSVAQDVRLGHAAGNWRHARSPGRTARREADAWLAVYGSRVRYVCVDDDADFLPHQICLQTNPDIGLTDEDARRCVRTLTNTDW